VNFPSSLDCVNRQCHASWLDTREFDLEALGDPQLLALCSGEKSDSASEIVLDESASLALSVPARVVVDLSTLG